MNHTFITYSRWYSLIGQIGAQVPLVGAIFKGVNLMIVTARTVQVYKNSENIISV